LSVSRHRSVQRSLTGTLQTSSLYIKSHICSPDLDELVLSVSTMLYCQVRVCESMNDACLSDSAKYYDMAF